MCTAITYKTKDFYFGINFDYDISYGEKIVITPREFKFEFTCKNGLKNHYAIIGMACVYKNYPLYYDAINEKGLCMAALNFLGNAYYGDMDIVKDNITQYDFIPWILSQCTSIQEVKDLLKDLNITNIPFDRKLPCADLHWIIADRYEAITVEAVKEGINIYDNPVGVLTNNPHFNEQLFALNNFINLSSSAPINSFSKKLELYPYSRGMGAIGLPGDLSFQSRFVRATFVKYNSIPEHGDTKEEDNMKCISQFFHILNSVSQQKGCCKISKNRYECTIYSSCCNVDKGIYYYTTYYNSQISAINMYNENLDTCKLITYPLIQEQQINPINYEII